MQQTNETLDTIFNRKSVRVFTGDPVAKEQVEILVRSAMSAPSAANRQPWSFIAITDTEVIKELADNVPNTPMLKTAGAIIAICALPEKSFPELENYWVADCSAATQNILLATESLGLGGVWIAVHQRQERSDAIRKALKIPVNVEPFSMVAIGHPLGGEQPKDKFSNDNLHWERW